MDQPLNPPAARRFGRLQKEGFFFFIYVVVTFFMTYPVLLRMGSVFYGLPEDPLVFQWMFWYMAKGGGGWVIGKVPIIGYPNGVDLSFWAREMGIFVPGRILTRFFGQTIAYNLLILASFILAGVFMYYLIKHLTQNAAVSFLAGLAYAFSPYHLAHATVHVNHASIQWLPLFFLCFFKLLERRSWTNAILAALTFTLVASSDFHYCLFAAILAAIIIIVRLFFSFREKRIQRFNGSTAIKVGVGLIIVAVLVAPFLVTLTSESGSPAISRRKGQSDLIKYSARPLEYVLPAAANPLLGRATRGYEYAHLHGAEEYETSNYQGIVVMVLALICLALYLGRRDRRRLGADTGNSSAYKEARDAAAGNAGTSGEGNESAVEVHAPPDRAGGKPDGPYVFSPIEAGFRLTVIWSMLVGVVVFFILSMPPYFKLGNTRIYLPSWLPHRVFPSFRSPSRFGLMVLFCLIVLASYGLEGLLQRGWFSRYAGFIVAALAILILLDYTIVPPFRYTEVKPPPGAYAWIAGKSTSGPIACYPMDQEGWYVYEQLYWQTTHRKVLLNAGGLPYGVDPQYQYIIDLMHPYTPRVLADLGVRKVVVIPSMWREAVALMAPRFAGQGFPVRLLPKGYRVERVFADGLVLNVASEAAVLIPHFQAGFEEPTLINNCYYRQRLNRAGRIRMQNTTGAELAVKLTFAARATRGPVTLQATLNGRPAGSWRVDSRERSFSTPALIFGSGNSELVLRVISPGGGTALSVLMSALDVKVAGSPY